ncbi:MAG: hypothetical protein GF384_01250 [Elusimicrobia bacterium]|nr:hypothetical protein [Elusimicrobiota bacterium]MBD3411660.1 hypothetical protein [Elusimicrobiota bacterium]
MVYGLIGVSVSLVTLALGYYVLSHSGKATDSTKTVGGIIGWIIVVVSVLMLVISLYTTATRSYGGGMGELGVKKHHMMRYQKQPQGE